MHLMALPALADNYIWLMHDDQGRAAVVDPGDADVVEKALAEHELSLHAILLTHHHQDHIGGVAQLRQSHPVEIHAPGDPRIDHVNQRVADGDVVELFGPDVRLEVLAVPGHTLSHIAYVGAGWLFCGDTLFSLGCGRLFEGSPEQMLASLDRLSALPPGTQVCCAHEYTASNGRFALEVEPENPDLAERLAEVARLRGLSLPTLPVPLARELETNPFLRIDRPALVRWGERNGVATSDRIGRFAALRQAKDHFRG
ncbi:hydroxyacylglutathione hydrolase [Dyella ginsengisoli]|uniref:hydroxyacylglutathione hydrolase n=1 Tax=Dyella ginsengisoli TaxID=363848 RepID=UPI00034A925F|nr:hydroxyacylglutathione hydrolase [Dyella ginsengisoli]